MQKYITGIIIGVCLAVTVFSVWYAFRLNSRVNNLEVFAGQVSTLINNASKAQTK